MKKVTRHGVFETNSSSTHSISIGSNKPEYPDFKGEEITLEQGEFGWEIRRFTIFLTDYSTHTHMLRIIGKRC